MDSDTSRACVPSCKSRSIRRSSAPCAAIAPALVAVNSSTRSASRAFGEGLSRAADHVASRFARWLISGRTTALRRSSPHRTPSTGSPTPPQRHRQHGQQAVGVVGSHPSQIGVRTGGTGRRTQPLSERARQGRVRLGDLPLGPPHHPASLGPRQSAYQKHRLRQQPGTDQHERDGGRDQQHGDEHIGAEAQRQGSHQLHCGPSCLTPCCSHVDQATDPRYPGPGERAPCSWCSWLHQEFGSPPHRAGERAAASLIPAVHSSPSGRKSP